jgi:hypothetical protein
MALSCLEPQSVPLEQAAGTNAAGSCLEPPLVGWRDYNGRLHRTQDTYDLISLLSSGFSAGLDQAGNRGPSFGQGTASYGKRFVATARAAGGIRLSELSGPA